jgi:hypothetical protein
MGIVLATREETILWNYKKMKNRKNKITKTTTTTVIRDSNGKFLQLLSNTNIKSRDDDYYKTYKYNSAVLDDLNRSEENILRRLLDFIDYDNIIKINSQERKDIITELGLTSLTLKTSLSKYIDIGIFLKICTNTFLVNPNLFAMGTWEDTAALRIKLIEGIYNKLNNL